MIQIKNGGRGKQIKMMRGEGRGGESSWENKENCKERWESESERKKRKYFIKKIKFPRRIE